jgi:hypothetical protein
MRCAPPARQIGCLHESISTEPLLRGWKLGEVKLDIRELPARDVIGIAVSSDRQTQQNILKLKALSSTSWPALVDLIQTQGLQASDQAVGGLLGYPPAQIPNVAAEIGAARSNMYGVVRALHDPSSRLLSGTLEALRRGSVVVIDISLLSSGAGNMLAGLLLRRIFAHNQENFTAGAQHPIIPVVAVVEEAQSVLGRNLEEGSPYVEWVKEGRKYDLGAILVTQQPGSMSSELLSQADNWFCFHLLSEGDAGTLGKYNSHYSEDILAHLIGEPIPGNCFMWSAPHQPFVLPVRVRSFEEAYRGNINSKPGAAAVAGIRAQRILASVSEGLDRLRAGWVDALKGPTVKFVAVEGAMADGGNGVGVYTGQLYHLIKDLKSPADTQTEEQLKVALLTLIFSEGNMKLARHPNGREYYCASVSDWTRVLGKAPKVSEG